ncbi:MAG: VCBS repeat-containing protein [Proteobacteria bacterium]|nr:VCBS repeat-containing protein [Pseudomonadota bacterium]
MRRAAALVAALFLAGPAFGRCVTGDGDWITRACYDRPKSDDLYRHDILGRTPEWSRLVVTLGPKGRAVRTGAALAFPVARRRLYEDVAPRLADLDGDGRPEIIAVESDHRRGARLLALFLDGRSAATPFIGTPRRWLAPVGVADLDGDGQAEIAYVEAPHLGKVLKIALLDANAIRVVAEAPGLTNHRVGDDFIQGRIALCDGRPTVLTANAGWSRIIGTRLEDGRAVSRDLGPYAGPESFADVPGCE